nr:MAG TPA: hypothetical protein [Caudoviricetes sp.]
MGNKLSYCYSPPTSSLQQVVSSSLTNKLQTLSCFLDKSP